MPTPIPSDDQALLTPPSGPEVDDPELAGRWAAMEHLPADTLGRRMWEFYQARGFAFPGEPGSAPPLLAQVQFASAQRAAADAGRPYQAYGATP